MNKKALKKGLIIFGIGFHQRVLHREDDAYRKGHPDRSFGWLPDYPGVGMDHEILSNPDYYCFLMQYNQFDCGRSI